MAAQDALALILAPPIWEENGGTILSNFAYTGHVVDRPWLRRMRRANVLKTTALPAIIMGALAASVAHADCPPLSAFDRAPTTNLEERVCQSGPQRYDSVEALNIEKSGFGRVIVSSVSARNDGANPGVAYGLLIEFGPYGEQNTYSSSYIDYDELDTLVKFLDDAIPFSAKSEAGTNQVRAMVFRTKEGWLLISRRGDLGGLSLRTGPLSYHWATEVPFSPEEGRALHNAIRSSVDTLKAMMVPQ